MISVQGVRDFFEIAYFISSVLLLLGLVLAWFQVRAINSSSKLANARLAKEKAIEASTRYIEKAISITNNEHIFRQEKGYGYFRGECGNFSLNTLDKSQREEGIKILSSNFQIVETLNELELIAAYFVSTVADEEVGFRIIGRSFCVTVKDRYDVITLLSSRSLSQTYWSNIIALYQIWAPKLERGELDISLRSLQEKLASLD